MVKRILETILRSTVLITLAMGGVLSVKAREAMELPVKVYLMVGQSNMQGKGAIEGEGSNSHRHMVRNDPGKEYQFLVKGDGEWVEREDVWIFLDQTPRESKYGGLMPGYGSSGGPI